MERIAVRAMARLEDMLRFWKGMGDDTFGGYYGYMGQDLKVDAKAEKGCILNSRILWFFSEAAMLTLREDLRREADHAYEFLMQHCLDRENGGVFWSVSYDGLILDDTKHTYNQAFTIYALSSYYLLTHKQEALEAAFSIFEKIETTCRDSEGYLEAFTRDWKPESNEKLSENGVLADKTMNTLLHIFEGYSNLYRCGRDSRVGQAMRRCLGIYTEKIYDPVLHRQKVFFDAHYHSILDLYSYGHDIEASWLMDWGNSRKSRTEQRIPFRERLLGFVKGLLRKILGSVNEELQGILFPAIKAVLWKCRGTAASAANPHLKCGQGNIAASNYFILPVGHGQQFLVRIGLDAQFKWYLCSCKAEFCFPVGYFYPKGIAPVSAFLGADIGLHHIGYLAG